MTNGTQKQITARWRTWDEISCTWLVFLTQAFQLSRYFRTSQKKRDLGDEKTQFLGVILEKLQSSTLESLLDLVVLPDVLLELVTDSLPFEDYLWFPHLCYRRNFISPQYGLQNAWCWSCVVPSFSLQHCSVSSVYRYSFHLLLVFSCCFLTGKMIVGGY